MEKEDDEAHRVPLARKQIPPWYKDPGSRKIAIFSIFTFCFLVAELVVGIMTGSLALLADAMHMLSDQLALLIGFVAIRWSKRQHSKIYSYGWIRAEVIGALINGVFLLSVTFFIILEAIQRFIELPEIVEPELVLIVAASGLVANVVGLIVFAGDSGISHGHSHGGGGHSHGGGGHSHSGGGHSHGGGGHSHGGHKEQKGDKKHKKHGHSHSHERAADAPEEKEDQPPVLPHETVTSSGLSIDLPVNFPAGGEESEIVTPEHDQQESPGHGRHEAKKPNLNMHGIFLHIVGDALGTIGAILSGTLMWQLTYDWRFYFDPICSVIIALIILRTSWPLVKRCAKILMQSVPENIDLSEISTEILKLPHVQDVHDLHVWQLADTKVVGTVHLRCPLSTDFEALVADVKRIFHTHGVHSTTIQPEFSQEAAPGCLVTCKTDACAPSLCCSPSTSSPGSPAELRSILVAPVTKEKTTTAHTDLP